MCNERNPRQTSSVGSSGPNASIMAGVTMILAMMLLKSAAFAGSIGGNTEPGWLIVLGQVETGARVQAVQSSDGCRGLRVTDAALACVTQPKPIKLEFHRESLRELTPTSRKAPQRWR